MKTYQYIAIRGQYLCHQQSLFRLTRLVFSRRNEETSTVTPSTLIRLALHRCRLKRYPTAITLPAFGVWCKPVNNGHKTFDPYTSVVTKIYNTTTAPEAIRKEIKQHTDVGRNPIAPSLLQANENEGWYQEELISGKTGNYFSPPETSDFMAIYHTQIAPTLARLIQQSDTPTTSIHQRIPPMLDAIQTDINRIAELDKETGQQAQAFFEKTKSNTQSIANQQVSLTFAHGDFHLYNLFKTPKGIKLIDWEGASQQSLLFDCYTYFFSHLWTNRPKGNLAPEFKRGIQVLADQLEPTNPQLASDIRDKADTYLTLYYIERLYTYATQFKLSPQGYSKWLGVYRDFENALKDTA